MCLSAFGCVAFTEANVCVWMCVAHALLININISVAFTGACLAMFGRQYAAAARGWCLNVIYCHDTRTSHTHTQTQTRPKSVLYRSILHCAVPMSLSQQLPTCSAYTASHNRFTINRPDTNTTDKPQSQLHGENQSELCVILVGTPVLVFDMLTQFD